MGLRRKTVEPRPETPAPGASDSVWSSGRLPDDLLAQQVQRLALLSAVAAGLWAFGLVMDRLVLITALPLNPDYNTGRATLVELVGIANSILMLLYVAYSRHSPQVKTDVGLAFMAFNAFLVAMGNSWVTPPLRTTIHLSWNAIVVLVYSMIAPSTPGRIAAASMVAASMDPFGVWLAHLRGVTVPSPLDTFISFLPNYICGAVAVLPAHVMSGLGRQIRQARELGSYQLVELLGHGGMGEVWRAQHRLLARNAAIKLVRPEVLGAANEVEAKMALRRFEREAQATAALGSPYSIRLFDFGVTNEGTFYYVMELLTGRDLETLVREFGPLPAERVIYLLRQICHSLADAHARGLVHRDIKPANIYVCRMGLDYDFVKVLDFGLVKFRGRDTGQTLMTADHTTTGTPAYMAPEIILGEADVDRRADVYALGCVAYFLLTGELVFQGDTPIKTMIQHVQAQPIPPSQRTELPIPRELDDFVMACLEKDPNKRPQDADQLLRIARRCTSCEGWSSEMAQAWWEQHLAQLSGPLTVIESRPEGLGRSLAVH